MCTLNISYSSFKKSLDSQLFLFLFVFKPLRLPRNYSRCIVNYCRKNVLKLKQSTTNFGLSNFNENLNLSREFTKAVEITIAGFFIVETKKKSEMKTFHRDNQNSSLLTQTEVNNPLLKKGRVYPFRTFTTEPTLSRLFIVIMSVNGLRTFTNEETK